MTGELRALTGVRGIAAWLVVLYHIRLSIAGLPQGVVDGLAKGYLAVDFFFLLSGFVIWMTWEPRLRQGGWVVVPTFLRKRFARIWPLHLFILACAVALALLLAATGRHDPREFPFEQLPLHILLVQNWGSAQSLTWNDPAWSISVESFAYLLFPLVTLTLDWRRLPTPVIVAAIVVLVGFLSLLMASRNAVTLGQDIVHSGLVRCVVQFVCGNAICALWLRWRASPTRPAIAAATIAATFSSAAIADVLPETFAIPVAFAALILTLALTSGRRGNPFEGRIVHYLGEISYATYLGHFLLWFAFKLAFVADPLAVPPALVALYLSLVLASSVALHYLVERPAQRALNGWHPRLPERKRPPAH